MKTTMTAAHHTGTCSTRKPFLMTCTGWGASLALALGMGLTGCSSAPPETFPKPDYSYLPPLNLNVADIAVVNDAPAAPDSLAAKAPPLPPADNLALMAQQRLHATGTTGHGTFTITQASLNQGPGEDMYSGTYSATLSLEDPTTHHRGRVTARVTHKTETAAGTTKAHNLYTLNQALMDDMNVELEYQIRKNLSSWLTDATGTPLSGGVQSQNLDQPGAALPPLTGGSSSLPTAASAVPASVPPISRPTTSAASSGATALAPPLSADDSGEDGGVSTAGRPHSPPPHTLQLPN